MMLSNVNRVLWIVSVLLLSFVVKGYSQTNYDLTYAFEWNTVKINGNQTFANKLLIKNNKSQTLKLTSNAKGTRTLAGLISLPDTLHLAPFEKLSFPLKYLADRNTIKNAHQTFTIELTSTDPSLNIQPSTSFISILEEAVRIKISTQQSEYYLDPSNHQTTVTIIAHNQGFVQANFNLHLMEIPEGLEFSGDLGEIQLAPGQQVLLPFSVRNKYVNRQTDYIVHIKAMDEIGNTIAEQRIKIMTISSVKRLSSQLYNQTRTNFIALQLQNANYNRSSYQLQGNGEINLGNLNRLNYSLNMELVDNLNHLFLYNTYLNYIGKTWGVKLGNITEDLDFQISGRGLSTFLKLRNNTIISLFGVENNYLLSDNFNHISFPKVFGATFKSSSSSKNSKFSIIHSYDGQRDIQSNQLSTRNYYRIGRHQTLKWEAGISAENMLNQDLMPGVSGSFEYNYDQQNFRFSSNHHWSSPYYTGLRRGLFQSETGIHVDLNDYQTISARVNMVRINPKYQDSQQFYNSDLKIENNIFEIGYILKLGNFRLDFRPYFQRQQTDIPFFHALNLTDVKTEYLSYRKSLNLNFLSKEHRLTINTDFGITKTKDISQQWDKFNSLRFNALYYFKNFGFNSFIQLNPYFISDQLNSTGINNYRVYSFGPNFNINLFKNKVTLQTNGSYNYYNSTRTSNISLNSTAKLKVKGNWAITGSAFIAEMQQLHSQNQTNIGLVNQKYFSNNQFRIGIEKNFNTKTQVGLNKLSLKYFDDANNNGKQDNGELNVRGIVVKVANHFAISDQKGEVKFYNIQEGNHRIQTVNGDGWQSQGGEFVNLTKNVHMNIPLVKVGRIIGAIKELETKYKAELANLSGIAVIARDMNGKSVKTLTDHMGTFTLYLPAGKYEVYVDCNGLAFKISDNHQSVLVDINKPQQVKFEYENQRRKIDIKKF